MVTHPYGRSGAVRLGIAVITPPAAEPISLGDAKGWLRIDEDDASEDLVILSLITAARQQIENSTGLKLLTQVVEQSVDRLPCVGEPIQLYVGPVQSVTSVTVYSATDVSSVVVNTDYIVEATRLAPRLFLATGAAWPIDLRWYRSAVIRVVAGYANADLVPEALKQAMRLMLEHWHNDCDGKPEKAGRTIDEVCEALIRPYRLEWI